MTNPVGNNQGPSFTGTPDVNEPSSSNAGNSSPEGEDIVARVAEQAGPILQGLDADGLRAGATEEGNNDWRESLSTEAPQGFFSGLLQRIRRVFRGICGCNRGSYAFRHQGSLSEFLADTEIVAGLESRENSSSGRGIQEHIRAFFHSVFLRCLSVLRGRWREQIDLKGYSPESPEGFFILACLTRFLCKLVTDDGVSRLENADVFLQHVQNSPALTIPAMARLEAVYEELSGIIRNPGSTHVTSRGLSLLLLLPPEQQNNFHQKMKDLSKTDPRHDYDRLLDVAQRLDKIGDSGPDEREALANLLYLLRSDFSNSLKQTLLQCVHRFDPTNQEQTVSTVLKEMLHKTNALFTSSSPRDAEAQRRFIVELVSKLYSAVP